MAKNYGLNADGGQVSVERADMVRFFPEDLLPMKNYRFGSFDTDPAVRAARDAEIEDMMESLLAEGQKTPITIHEVPGKRFQVTFGDTRHRAMLRINERGIPWPHGKEEDGGRARIECKVENFAKDADKHVFASSVAENLQRNNLTVIDLCFAVAEAERLHYTDAEIQAKFRQTDPAWLPNMRRLARLPDTRKRDIHMGHMAASVGYLLAEIPEWAHEEILAEASGATVQPEPEPAVAEEPGSIIDNLNAIDAIIAEAEAEDGILSKTPERTLDTSESQLPPPKKTTAPPKSSRLPKKTAKPAPPRKATARAVTEAARKHGFLKHKKIAHTVAGMRAFWAPITQERAGSLIARLAEANLAWIDGANDDEFYAAVLAVLKEVKR